MAFLVLMGAILILCNDWLTYNSDALMVLITFVYVVATVEICRANINAAEASREQLAESKRQFDETKRLQVMPFLQIEVQNPIVNRIERSFSPCMLIVLDDSESEKCRIYNCSICIKNIGSGVAHKISCDYFSPKQFSNENRSNVAICANGVFSENAQFIIHDNRTDAHCVKFSTVIRYCDILGNKYFQILDMLFFLKLNKESEDYEFRFLHADLNAPEADVEKE